MYKFRISSVFVWIYSISVLAYTIFVASVMIINYTSAKSIMSDIGATKIVAQRENLFIRYGYSYGTMESVKEDVFGDSSSSSVKSELYTMYLFYDANGKDAIDCKEDFNKIAKVAFSVNDRLSFLFLTTAIAIFICFVSLCQGIFSDGKFWFEIVSIGSIIVIASLIYSNKYYISIIALIISLIMALFGVFEIIRINRVNYKIQHRHDVIQ